MLRILSILLTALIITLGISSCSSVKHTSKHKGKVENSSIKTAHLSKAQKKLIKEAESWLGTPYKYAKAEKGIGTDCSGLVLQIYLTTFELKLPRNSAKQAEFCTPLKAKDVRAGDLVFFATGKNPRKVSHVGMMLDSENFIHASSSKGVVVSKMSNPYYQKRFLMYGRVPQFLSLLD